MKAVVFDMDGLLIDSEPLWKQAEISVLRSVGVPLTEELCRETTGVRLDATIRHWYERFPWRRITLEEVHTRILEAVTESILERGEPKEGALELVRECHEAPYALAVASSSPMPLICAVLRKFGILEFFSVLHSAEDETEGKPHPAVYLSTISRLGVNPTACLAFEDSLSGVQAAKAAGASVVAIPAAEDASEPGFDAADLVLSSLTEFSLPEFLARRRLK